MTEKNNGEEELQPDLGYGAGPFDMTEDAEGNYHSAAAGGIDHNWGKNPFDDETAEQTCPIPEASAEGKSTDEDKEK